MKVPILVKEERELLRKVRNVRHLGLEEWQLFDELQMLERRGLSEERYWNIFFEIQMAFNARNRQYPFISQLVLRIIAHRHTCKGWKKNEPCFDCHWGLIGRIEEELSRPPIGLAPKDILEGVSGELKRLKK